MITNFFIKQLYNNYKNELMDIRKNMKLRYDFVKWNPQFDDTEAEITALLLLFFKPNNIIEFSPCNGWSTSIMLDALTFNSNNPKLTSYDIHDNCLQNITSNEKWNKIWDFKQGDVTLKFKEWDLNKVNYLFIDSDHSHEFAKKYINELLMPLLIQCKINSKEVIVSVHDVFHNDNPSEEGNEVINFLQQNNLSYYTPSWRKENYKELMCIKKNLGFDSVIHKSWGREDLELQTNSCIFFVLK